MKKYTLLCLFLFLAVSTVRADDIATIKNFLDNKTDDTAVLYNVYAACLSLTRTGTDEAVPVLKQLLDDERFSTVARTALLNLSGEAERKILRESQATLDRTEETALLKQLLETADNRDSFKRLQRAILELKLKDTGIIVLDNLKNLPPEKQAALIANLGARKDAAIVPRLMELARSDQLAIQWAAIAALGEIGDVAAVDTLLLAAGSENTEIAKMATANLKLLQGGEFNKKIIALFDSNDKKLRLAALDIIGERQISEASGRLRNWDYLTVSDIETRTAAMRAFALSAPPTVENIRFPMDLLKTLEKMNRETDDERAFTREALLVLCRRTADRDKVVELFAMELKTAHGGSGSVYLDCLFQLGGEKAAACLAATAMGTDDTLTDRATQLLGRWTTPEVAPYLLEIAAKHPNERYRSRTLSGYLRVIRQMGLPVEQKVQMAEKALTVAQTDIDKQRASEVLQRFRAMAKGTPIFDGKTFDGWEFRGNEKWFRIEDGSIVCGSMEEQIPHNEFITTKKEYGDFTLRIECKVLGSGVNGGVQFRSVRAPADGTMLSEMIGYQADMTETANYWGALYDESRRNRFLAEPKKELIESLFRPNDWNEYEIVCKGNNVKIYLNGTLTVDYTEQDATIPACGLIGLQIHAGPPSETRYRNIRLVAE
jgi:HEAT repeat protein